MLVLNGSFKTLDEAVKSIYALRGLTTFKSYKNRSEIEFRLSNYKKFMSYREPLNRFAADYLMLRTRSRSHDAQSKRAVQYADSVRGHPHPQHPWQNMSIQDFGTYVVRFGNETTGLDKLDKQWIPQNLACHPCHIQYDYYIDMESSTVNEDIHYILAMIGADWLKMPHVNPTTKDKSPYLSLLSESMYNRLLSVYYNDYEIFGFKRPRRKE